MPGDLDRRTDRISALTKSVVVLSATKCRAAKLLCGRHAVSPTMRRHFVNGLVCDGQDVIMLSWELVRHLDDPDLPMDVTMGQAMFTRLPSH